MGRRLDFEKEKNKEKNPPVSSSPHLEHAPTLPFPPPPPPPEDRHICFVPVEHKFFRGGNLAQFSQNDVWQTVQNSLFFLGEGNIFEIEN